MATTLKHKSPDGHHLAAIQAGPGLPILVQDRPTPTAGPGDVLIDVLAIALNPVDAYMHVGHLLKTYPATYGSDAAGLIISAGSSVPAPFHSAGTRVLAFCPFFATLDSDRGAFQRKVIVPYEYLALVPDSCSLLEAAKLPMAILTTWNGLRTIGIASPAQTATVLPPHEKKGVLVWGGASSVGSVAIQVCRLLGYTVVTTARAHHHSYLRSIGANHVFDYKRASVVDDIVSAFQAEDITLDFVFDAVGSAAEINAVVQRLKPAGRTKMAYAPLVKPETPRCDEVELMFIVPPKDDADQRSWSQVVFNDWLSSVLAKKLFVPSPLPRLVGGGGTGLECLEAGLEEMRKGGSGSKLMVDISVHGTAGDLAYLK